MKLISMIPLRTAIPLSAMNPTPALMVKGMSRSRSVNTPPVTASGTPTSACKTLAPTVCEHSSGHGQRHAHENERGLTQAAKAHVDQDENEAQRHRHDQGQPRLLQVFELAAELIVVARR